MWVSQANHSYHGNVMNSFRIPILTSALILGTLGAAQLNAQTLSVTVDDASTSFILEDLLEFDALGEGHRATRRLHLDFDAPEGTTVNIKSLVIRGAPEFSWQVETSAPPVAVVNLFLYPLLIHFQPRGPGPFVAVMELVATYTDSETGESFDVVHTYTLVGRVPSFSLSYVLPGGTRDGVPLAGVVDFGRRPTGVSTVATVVVSNGGNGPGVIRGVRVSGASAYKLVDLPQFPVRLEPGSEITLQVAFTPPSTFSQHGALVLDYGATRGQYVLAGIGGELLRYRVIAYADGSSAGRVTSVQSGSTITFGREATVIEVVGQNLRANAQLVETVRVTGPFVITDGPRLPKAVGPGESITIRLEPSSSARGDLSGELVIDDSVFSLALDLPPLPSVQFSSSGETLGAGQSMPIGLSLHQPYPVDIDGTLHLGLDLEDPQSDPTLKWSGGGRQVGFRILAGETVAEFAGGATMAEFQATSVSSVITVTAQFVAAPWGIDVTPAAEPQVQFTVDVLELPAVIFTREGGSVRAGERIELGLGLADAYPEALSGTLQLSFEGKDPGSGTGPWASGMQQVRFRIPAGETGAMFADGFSSTQFRAPTAEGKVTVMARFVTEDAGADITPDSAPELEFIVEITELPRVKFSRASGTVSAAEQIALDLSLGSTYPTDIVGILTLAFETRAFANDPTIQWSTGGRQAAFLIVAGSTDAFFTGNVTSTAFQTGTVAGEIVVAARFFSVPDGFVNVPSDPQAQLQAGAEITPETTAELRFNVMEAAPVLSRVALGSTGQGRFSLQVTGYSTAREVNSVSFVFAGSTGSDLQTPQLEADVSENFQTYYSGNQSAAFGSQFTATVEFTLDEGVFEDLNTVSVSATNTYGESDSVSLLLN